MAAITRKLLLFLAMNLAENALAQDNFEIIEPFPENIYPIEGTSAKITCVAFDSSGVKTPARIQFMRKDQYARYTNISATENIYFTNRIKVVVDQDGKELKKLFVTMHIKHVTEDDDSQYGPLGRYECHAFAVGNPKERKHGFSVNVIRKNEIPTVSVSKAGILQHGANITISCNLTKGKSSQSPGLKRISWYKDNKLVQTVRNPDPDKPQDFLGPLRITNVGVRDGGNYMCKLEVKLRNVKEHNVSDSTMIRIAPWFDKAKDGLFEGNTVSFECAIKGFPLQVEWKFQKQGEDTVRSCINGSDGKHVQRNGIYAPYVLTVSDIQDTDLGFYYCCLPSNCSDNVKDNCQRFVLQGPVRSQSTQCHIQEGYLLATLILSVMSTIARNEL